MNKEVKVVIGANYGDEGKGLVSYCLSRKAISKEHRVLNVFYNGGCQRAHTSHGVVHHCTGAGTSVGADTYYNEWFVVDPIAVWLEKAEVYVHPKCRVVLPCDVINNRQKELTRGSNKHGSCGMGIFEAVKRNTEPKFAMLYKDTLENNLYDELIRIEKQYGYPNDLVYNNDNFLRACLWMWANCRMVYDEKTLFNRYDTIIFEGGQGLLLDQIHHTLSGDIHTTPSSPGIRNCLDNINALGIAPELYYISRGYMTRHGAGSMECECGKNLINKLIVDETNQPNPWQDNLRFGRLKQETLHERVLHDAIEGALNLGSKNPSVNLVFTQLNYTNGQIAGPGGKNEDIIFPDFVDHIYVSDQKDEMEMWK